MDFHPVNESNTFSRAYIRIGIRDLWRSKGESLWRKEKIKSQSEKVERRARGNQSHHWFHELHFLHVLEEVTVLTLEHVLPQLLLRLCRQWHHGTAVSCKHIGGLLERIEVARLQGLVTTYWLQCILWIRPEVNLKAVPKSSQVKMSVCCLQLKKFFLWQCVLE